jgi:hypothetical protein
MLFLLGVLSPAEVVEQHAVVHAATEGGRVVLTERGRRGRDQFPLHVRRFGQLARDEQDVGQQPLAEQGFQIRGAE